MTIGIGAWKTRGRLWDRTGVDTIRRLESVLLADGWGGLGLAGPPAMDGRRVVGVCRGARSGDLEQLRAGNARRGISSCHPRKRLRWKSPCSACGSTRPRRHRRASRRLRSAARLGRVSSHYVLVIPSTPMRCNSWARWQRAKCCGATSSQAGVCVRQTSTACGQRG